MSLDYYIEFERKTSLAELLELSSVVFTGSSNNGAFDDDTGLNLNVIQNQAEDDTTSPVKTSFNFEPKTSALFTFKKTKTEACEALFMEIVLGVIKDMEGDAIIGFSQSDRPFLHKKGGQLELDTAWEDIISLSSFNMVKKEFPNLAITLLQSWAVD